MPNTNFAIPQSADALGYIPQSVDINALLDSCAGVLSRYVGASAQQASANRTALKSSLNPTLFASLDQYLLALAVNQRFDIRFRQDMRGIVTTLEQQLSQSKQLPSTWQLTPPGSPHILDAWLSRCNGNSLLPTPTTALTLTPNTLGTIPNCTMSNAPRVVFTYVGAYDSVESLPSPESTQFALTGSNNGYTATVTGTIPTGVTKVRVYRGLVGGVTGTYYFERDVPVNAGQAFPSINILYPDSLLRNGIVPPSWMSVAQSPESAALYALAWAGSTVPGVVDSPLKFQANAILSPTNVLLNRSDGFVGVGNSAMGSVFSTGVITAANTITNTTGTIQNTNVLNLNVQGYSGAMGLQARVTSAMSAGGTVSISYFYYDAAHGWGVNQSDTATATLSSGAVGTVAVFPITSGRVVTMATFTATSGSSTSGSVLIESLFPRQY